jgi:hypothetical protein
VLERLVYNQVFSFIEKQKNLFETESSMKTMTCGVPQGSTLGPLLFLLYINDLPNSSKKLLFRSFADDTNIFYSSNNINELEKTINDELKHILKYCNENKPSINFKKTNYMLIRLQYNNRNVQHRTKEKYKILRCFHRRTLTIGCSTETRSKQDCKKYWSYK